MSEAQTGGCCGASRRESGDATARGLPSLGVPALGVADWLYLAAAPTFAIMALLTGVHGGSPMDPICSPAQDAFPLSGMALMYVLMSVFHLAPWLKLISRRRNGATRGDFGRKAI